MEIEMPKPNYPSYRDMVMKEAERDPSYAKYKGRIHLTEPNGMSEYAFRKRGRKKHYVFGKKAQRLCF